MGEPSALQRHSNALICLLAGAAAVAVAATYFSRRSSVGKRPHNGQQSAKLQQLLAEVMLNGGYQPRFQTPSAYDESCIGFGLC